MSLVPLLFVGWPLETGQHLEVNLLLALGIPFNVTVAGFRAVAHGMGAVGHGIIPIGIRCWSLVPPSPNPERGIWEVFLKDSLGGTGMSFG